MKQILILSFVPVTQDPRVCRQIQWLKSSYSLITAGPGNTAFPEIPHHSYPAPTGTNFFTKLKRVFLLLTHQFQAFYWTSAHVIAAQKSTENIQADIIFANEIDTLPLAIEIQKKSKCPIIFDAHEFYPGVHEDLLWWKYLVSPYMHWLCKTGFPFITQAITVSDGISNLYQKLYGLNTNVISNAPPYHTIEVKETCHPIKLVHHGLAMPDRKIEEMIDIAKLLGSDYSLDLILVPSHPKYYEKLKKKAALTQNVKLLQPVPRSELVNVLSEYDIGIYLLQPDSRNLMYALPNKFFDFIQARLAIAIGPSPDMAKIVTKYQCGIVADNFNPKNLADKIRKLETQEIYRLRKNSEKASQEINANKNEQIMLKILEKSIKKP